MCLYSYEVNCPQTEVHDKRVHNQSKAIASAPSEQTTFVNLLIYLYIVYFLLFRDGEIFSKFFALAIISIKRNKCKYLARE